MVNRATILGRLGQDVALRYTPTGISVARISVATNAYYKDANGEQVEKTDWHNVVVFQRLAENCALYLRKGSLVYVEGSLSTRKWRDQEGIERYTTEITARRIQFLDRKVDECCAACKNGIPSQGSRHSPNNPAGIGERVFCVTGRGAVKLGGGSI